jgi:hypothetical protein
MVEQETNRATTPGALGSPEARAAGLNVILEKLRAEAKGEMEMAEIEHAAQLIRIVVQNTGDGIVDFDIQREYMQTMNKIPQMRALIYAPAWVTPLMLPGRGGFWIYSVTPGSPASFCKEIEFQNQIIVGIFEEPLPNEPGTAFEKIGLIRWELAKIGKPCALTVYNLKSRLFSTITIESNPANLTEPPMAIGLMMKWVEGAQGNGITPNNAEPKGLVGAGQ